MLSERPVLRDREVGLSGRIRSGCACAGRGRYWFGERELSETWFREQFERTVAALDERYHPEDHVDVGASQLFQALRGSADWRGGYRQPLAALAELLPDDPGEGTPDAPLGWILTSSNRTLRDRATKAATEILMRHPGAAAPFVERFAGVDDPYVVERVLAAVAGACLRNPQADRVATAADAIWRHVFSGASIPLHILARDYGRLVMELALDRDVLPEGCDIRQRNPA